MKNSFEQMPQEENKEYPPDFINKVKEEFPDWKALHEALDADSESVGHFLDDQRDLKIGAEEIIEAFESKKEKTILEEAKRSDRINKLWEEWCSYRQPGENSEDNAESQHIRKTKGGFIRKNKGGQNLM